MPPTGRRRARERVLIVRLAGIGDVVMASALLERLRAERPDAEVVWLCGQLAEPIVREFDGVSRIVTVNERHLLRGSPIQRARAILGVWSRLVRLRPAHVFLLHVDRRYRVLVAPLIGAKKSYSTRERHGEMNPVPGRYLGDEYVRLLDGPEHRGPIERRYEIANLRGELRASHAPGDRPSVIIVPGGARNVLRDDDLRRWPTESYAAVARALIADGCGVILLGGPDDTWVRPHFEGLPITDRIGSLALPDVLELMRASNLVISHDTGPMHLARLVRAPLLALFGPTSPHQFLSIDDTVTVLWGGEHLACRPCYDGREFAACANNICLGGIVPARVVDEARAILSRPQRPVPSL